VATQLSLYNGALKILGEPRLASTSEEREPRRALDDVYAEALAYCLKEGQWIFAKRQVEIAHDVNDAPAFGFSYAFDKPTDWVRTMALSSDEFFRCPLIDADDVRTHWYANITPIWVQYVSNDAASYGMLLSAWPPAFTLYVEHELARRICLQVTNSKADYERVEKELKKYKRDALNKDAVSDIQPKFRPRGAFVRSRLAEGEYAGRYVGGVYYR
jgi:hypothetical protein